MKILINIKCINCPGGVAQIYNMLQLDKQSKIDYFIASPKTNNILKPILFIIKYIDFYFTINKYDIIHINPSLGKTAIWRDLIFLLLAKLRNKKIIVFMHGWEDTYENIIKNSKTLSKLFLKYNKVDAFFVLGDIFKQKLIGLGISPNKKFYIETTIADDRYISDFNINEKINSYKNKEQILKFLFISRITTGKGMKLAIDIFNKIQKVNKRKMEFIIAGDGDKLQETKDYVKHNNINNIVFAGYVKDEQKHKLLKESDIMLFPTMYGEGLPNSILEGMLYGIPVISRINAGIPDWVKNNENGFITKSTNADVFVSFIVKLLNDDELFEKIARNNHKLAKRMFIKDVITKRFLEHYKEIYN